MHSIQVADQTFVAAPGAHVAAEICGSRNLGGSRPPSQWRRWWPDLELTVREDRGADGVRWAVVGAVTGTMEVWLEPSLDGVILHFFMHAEPAVKARDMAAFVKALRVAGKRMAFEVKASLEQGRPAGVAPATVGG